MSTATRRRTTATRGPHDAWNQRVMGQILFVDLRRTAQPPRESKREPHHGHCYHVSHLPDGCACGSWWSAVRERTVKATGRDGRSEKHHHAGAHRRCHQYRRSRCEKTDGWAWRLSFCPLRCHRWPPYRMGRSQTPSFCNLLESVMTGAMRTGNRESWNCGNNRRRWMLGRLR